MYSVFNGIPTVARGSLAFPKFPYLQRGLTQDLEQVTQFYRSAGMATRSDHFLARLLHSINIQITDDVFSYIGKVTDMALDLAMSLKMTSSQYAGKVHHTGICYGDGIGEVLLADISDFDPLTAETDWETLAPITVLSHPVTTMSIPELFGRGTFVDSGFAVLNVNIPMLAFQYRCWRLREMSEGNDNQQSIYQFLTAYPLTNVLRSHLNVAYFNMLAAQYAQRPMLQGSFKHSFWVLDRTDYCTDLIRTQLQAYEGRSWSMEQLMMDMPCPLGGTVMDLIQLPDVHYTRQVLWALVLARLPYMSWLLKFNADNHLVNTDRTLNHIKTDLRDIRSDRSVTSSVGNDVANYINRCIETDIAPYV